MVVKIISAYLNANKRLVIPQLGVFIVKEPGVCVVFSELLRRDDGVARGLLMEEGISEMEAAGAIDRFVFEVRHSLQNGAKHPLAGLGYLHQTNNNILFEYDPSTATETIENQETVVDNSIAGAEIERLSEVLKPEIEEVKTTQTCESKPLQESGNAKKSEDHAPSSQLAAILEGSEDDSKEDKASPSQKIDSEDTNHLEGLSYHKPRKTTDAYTYVDNRRGGKKVDKFLIIAIFAAILAVAAIVFGYIIEMGEIL